MARANQPPGASNRCIDHASLLAREVICGMPPSMSEIPRNVLYHFKTPVGILWIRPQPDSGGRVWLGIDDNMPIGSYHSARSAAEEVRSQTTGISQWDMLRGFQPPADLTEWSPGPPEN